MDIIAYAKQALGFLMKPLVWLFSHLADKALQDQNADLKEKLRARENADDLRKRLFFARNAYWRRDETEKKAYCPGCFDSKGQLITLVGDGCCPCCKIRYHKSLYEAIRPNGPED